jgi:hypothetical protein
VYKYVILSYWMPLKMRNVSEGSLMFVPCILDVVEMTNTMHWLYHSFIPYTGSYMLRQLPAIIRELLSSFWVTWNTHRMGGISYNVWLRGLCAGVSVVLLSAAGKHTRQNHNTPAHRPRNHTLNDIPPIRFVFQVTQGNLISSLMMTGYCRNM